MHQLTVEVGRLWLRLPGEEASAPCPPDNCRGSYSEAPPYLTRRLVVLEMVSALPPLAPALLALLAPCLAYSPEEPLLYSSFPQDFLWGSATAAYQVLRTSHHPLTSQTTYLEHRWKVPGMRRGRVPVYGMYLLR